MVGWRPVGRLRSPSRCHANGGVAPLQDDALLDDIIDRLLDVRTGRPGKQVALSETEVRGAPPACLRRPARAVQPHRASTLP